jgi:hypothetical protein
VDGGSRGDIVDEETLDMYLLLEFGYERDEREVAERDGICNL